MHTLSLILSELTEQNFSTKTIPIGKLFVVPNMHKNLLPVGIRRTAPRNYICVYVINGDRICPMLMTFNELQSCQNAELSFTEKLSYGKIETLNIPSSKITEIVRVKYGSSDRVLSFTNELFCNAIRRASSYSRSVPKLSKFSYFLYKLLRKL